METRSTAKIIPFPDSRRWPTIARRYVDNMTLGDPRAAFFYLEHQLSALHLSRPPAALRTAVEKEFRKRGFRGPFNIDGFS